MATGRTTQLTGAIGEFLVAAELCRRGLLATPFAGNVPHYDIIASGQFGGHVAVQVKAINGQTWQFDIRKFAKVSLEGGRQTIGQLESEPFPDLTYVFVVLRPEPRSEPNERDRFFVLKWKELQDILVPEYEHYLRKHNGIRPKKADSYHTALAVGQVEAFEDRWNVILDQVPKSPDQG
jgi:hypothetical protein